MFFHGLLGNIVVRLRFVILAVADQVILIPVIRALDKEKHILKSRGSPLLALDQEVDHSAAMERSVIYVGSVDPYGLQCRRKPR